MTKCERKLEQILKAKNERVISEFKGHYGFLSNFISTPVRYGGQEFPTVEHAFQAAKTSSQVWWDKIKACDTAGKAKKVGRQVPLRADWDHVKVGVMRDLLRQKFEKGTRMRESLDKTKGSTLIEGNWWGDTFWGQCPLGTGENWLGKLLMEIRDGG